MRRSEVDSIMLYSMLECMASTQIFHASVLESLRLLPCQLADVDSLLSLWKYLDWSPALPQTLEFELASFSSA